MLNVLCFGAHPDDIEVGMGGTVAKFSRAGHCVVAVIATIPSQKETRRLEAKEAAGLLGVKDLLFMDLEPDDVTAERQLITTIDGILNRFDPDIIYAPWFGDSHQDHVALSRAVIASSRKNLCSVYMYEQTIPGGIVPDTFRAQKYVDISDTIDLKLQSVLAHASQTALGCEHWLTGIKGRAMFRGCQIKVSYAETRIRFGSYDLKQLDGVGTRRVTNCS